MFLHGQSFLLLLSTQVVVVPTDVQNKDEKELVLMQRYTRGTSRQPGEDEGIWR